MKNKTQKNQEKIDGVANESDSSDEAEGDVESKHDEANIEQENVRTMPEHKQNEAMDRVYISQSTRETRERNWMVKTTAWTKKMLGEQKTKSQKMDVR